MLYDSDFVAVVEWVGCAWDMEVLGLWVVVVALVCFVELGFGNMVVVQELQVEVVVRIDAFDDGMLVGCFGDLVGCKKVFMLGFVFFMVFFCFLWVRG